MVAWTPHVMSCHLIEKKRRNKKKKGPRIPVLSLWKRKGMTAKSEWGLFFFIFLTAQRSPEDCLTSSSGQVVPSLHITRLQCRELEMYSIALWTQMCPLRQKTKPWRWEPAWTLELPYHPPWLAHKHGAESCSIFSPLQSSCKIWKQSILKSRSEDFFFFFFNSEALIMILSDCLLPYFHPVHHQVPYPMLYFFF